MSPSANSPRGLLSHVYLSSLRFQAVCCLHTSPLPSTPAKPYSNFDLLLPHHLDFLDVRHFQVRLLNLPLSSVSVLYEVLSPLRRFTFSKMSHTVLPFIVRYVFLISSSKLRHPKRGKRVFLIEPFRLSCLVTKSPSNVCSFSHWKLQGFTCHSNTYARMSLFLYLRTGVDKLLSLGPIQPTTWLRK